VALDYANEKKFPEAHQVLLRLQSEIEQTLEFQAKNSLKTKKSVQATKDSESILKESKTVGAKVVSRLLLQKQEKMKDFEKQMG